MSFNGFTGVASYATPLAVFLKPGALDTHFSSGRKQPRGTSSHAIMRSRRELRTQHKNCDVPPRGSGLYSELPARWKAPRFHFQQIIRMRGNVMKGVCNVRNTTPS